MATTEYAETASDSMFFDLLGMIFAFFVMFFTWFLFKGFAMKNLSKRDQSTNTDEFDLQHAHLMSIMSKQELWLWELWNLATEEEKRAHDFG